MKQERALAITSIFLVVALLLNMGSGLMGLERSRPANPLSSPESLEPEFLQGSGTLRGDGTGEQTAVTPPEDPTDGTEEPTEPPQTDPTQPEQTDPTQPEETDPTQPEETAPSQPSQTEPDDDPQQPQPGDDGDVGQDTPGDQTGGNTDTDTEPGGPAGDDSPGGSGEGGNVPGDAEDDSPKIVTDLRTRQVSRSELPGGVLTFYAYPSVTEEIYTVKAVVTNSATPGNGLVLKSDDGIHYEAPLVLNETTTITLYLKENGDNIAYVRYQIRYETEKADENTPEVGENPPTIITNLDGYTDLMETQDFIFWVSARTNPEGDPIYSNQIEVWLNDELLTKQTGDSRPEYQLHFEPPNVGDYAQYTVKVRAWDGRGNSTMKVYTVNYHTVSEGDYLGEVTLLLDATTVGLGIIDSATYEIVQGDTAAGVVIRFLEEYGYDAVYDGSANIGFYLRSISRGDLCRSASVPEKLWNMILRDGIQLSGHSDRDSLGEYDYTMGSGWMYSINGSIYPGRGLSDYPLSSNTTIYLRFTLAYGKDIGGFDATGQGIGSLSSYCGIWVGGGYVPLTHDFQETGRIEPTQTEDGYIEYTCTKCGETKHEDLPMTGEPTTPPETEPPVTEPPETEPPVTEPPVTEPPEPEITTPPEPTGPDEEENES